MATHTGMSYEDPQQPVGSPRGVSEKQKPTPPSPCLRANGCRASAQTQLGAAICVWT